MQKDTSWGKVANWYDEVVKDGDSYQSKVIAPNILRILDPKAGESVLDLACGQGFFSKLIIEKGSKVIGIDIGKDLIEIAKKENPKGDFYVGSADNISNTSDKSIDKVVCILALQNIEKLDQTLKEVSRVLKEKGKFVFVLNHPAFRIPKNSSWQFEEETHSQYRRIDAYMSESSTEIDMNPGKKLDKTSKTVTLSFHRPLQVYSKLLDKNNLYIKRMEEWISHKISEPGKKANEENRIRKEIPMFLCIECVKV